MTASQLRVDLLVIGFGKGGKTLAAAMGKRGRRVAMVEQSAQMYGGTCINIGCVPTKALVHEASLRRTEDDAEDWYRHAVKNTHDLTSLMRGNNFRMLDTIDTVTVITGRARFTGPRTVEVAAGEDRLVVEADTIVINTGAEPVTGGFTLGGRIVTSTELLATRELPERLVIVGGGYVGIEFAAMYARFGADVTVLDHAPHILRGEDRDVATAVADILHGQGITLIGDADATDVDQLGTVTYQRGGTMTSIDADAVLIALGRKPATDGLGLAAAGVDVTPSGAVAVDQHLRTSQPHIFAVGDVNGGPQFTYVSLDDHRIVLDQLIGEGTRSTADRIAVPHTIFLSPPLARVGLTETQARAAGHTILVATKPIAQLAASPRFRIMHDTRGLMKFVVDAATDQILGATLFCLDAQELINLVALAMRHGITATELRDTIYTHPSTSEAFTEVLGTYSAG